MDGVAEVISETRVHRGTLDLECRGDLWIRGTGVSCGWGCRGDLWMEGAGVRCGWECRGNLWKGLQK